MLHSISLSALVGSVASSVMLCFRLECGFYWQCGCLNLSLPSCVTSLHLRVCQNSSAEEAQCQVSPGLRYLHPEILIFINMTTKTSCDHESTHFFFCIWLWYLHQYMCYYWGVFFCSLFITMWYSIQLIWIFNLLFCFNIDAKYNLDS